MYNILACIKHVLLMWANRGSTHFKIRQRGSCTPDFLHISSANWDAATVLLSVSHTKPHTHTHTTWLLSANSCLQLFTVRLSDRERERGNAEKLPCPTQAASLQRLWNTCHNEGHAARSSDLWASMSVSVCVCVARVVMCILPSIWTEISFTCNGVEQHKHINSKQPTQRRCGQTSARVTDLIQESCS